MKYDVVVMKAVKECVFTKHHRLLGDSSEILQYPAANILKETHNASPLSACSFFLLFPSIQIYASNNWYRVSYSAKTNSMTQTSHMISDELETVGIGDVRFALSVQYKVCVSKHYSNALLA